MTEFKTNVDNEVHRKLAVDLFNYTWDLIEKNDRTAMENDWMIHAAHASRFHWGIVGTPLHWARGEWQISRVYAIVGRAEPALYHAQKSLELCIENNLGDFDLGFAYEAMARAYAVQGNATERDRYIELTRQTGERIAEESDKDWLLKNVDTVESLSLPRWE
jgi:hypothetical protein